MRTWVAWGAVHGFLAVAAGAFGAHALKARLSPEMLGVFETGARYHMYHALALLGVGLLAGQGLPAKAAGWCFSLGILLFSGSLYALATTGIRALGAVTPLGGVAFLLGWASVVWASVRP